MNLKALIGELPQSIQYIAVLALVMAILYLCLTLTRVLGQGRGKQIKYDDPETYEKQVPDLFATTALKRPVKNDEAPDEKPKSE